MFNGSLDGNGDYSLVSTELSKSASRILTNVEGESNGSRKHECTNQFDKHNELHAEAKSATQITNQDQFHKIVNCTVDPSSSLREKNLEFVGYSRFADSLRNKDLLSLGEGPQHQSREVTIFTKKEQVFLVQGVDDVFGIMLHDVGIGQDWHPVILIALWCLDSVHAETSGKTGDTTKNRLKGFGLMM